MASLWRSSSTCNASGSPPGVGAVGQTACRRTKHSSASDGTFTSCSSVTSNLARFVPSYGATCPQFRTAWR